MVSAPLVWYRCSVCATVADADAAPQTLFKVGYLGLIHNAFWRLNDSSNSYTY